MLRLPYDLVFEIIALFWAYKFEKDDEEETDNIAEELQRINEAWNKTPEHRKPTEMVSMSAAMKDLRCRDAKIRSKRRWAVYKTILLVCKEWREIMMICRWQLIVLNSGLDRRIYSRMIRYHLAFHGEDAGSQFHLDLLQGSHIEADLRGGWPNWDTFICQYSHSARISAPRLSWLFGRDKTNSFNCLSTLDLAVGERDAEMDGIGGRMFITQVRNLRLRPLPRQLGGQNDSHFYNHLGAVLKHFPNVEELTFSDAIAHLYAFAPHTLSPLQTVVIDLRGLEQTSLIHWSISSSLRNGLFKLPSTYSRRNQIVVRGSREIPVDFELAISNCDRYNVSLVWAPL